MNNDEYADELNKVESNGNRFASNAGVDPFLDHIRDIWKDYGNKLIEAKDKADELYPNLRDKTLNEHSLTLGVLADYLEEHGDIRHDIIRKQLEEEANYETGNNAKGKFKTGASYTGISGYGVTVPLERNHYININAYKGHFKIKWNRAGAMQGVAAWYTPDEARPFAEQLPYHESNKFMSYINDHIFKKDKKHD